MIGSFIQYTTPIRKSQYKNATMCSKQIAEATGTPTHPPGVSKPRIASTAYVRTHRKNSLYHLTTYKMKFS